MNIYSLLALIVLIIGVPLNLLVTGMLWQRHKVSPTNRVLRERFITAAVVLVLVVVFGLIFVNNDRLPPPLDTDVTKLITRLAFLGLAVIPAGYWLILYRAR